MESLKFLFLIATFSCLKCLTPNSKFNVVYEETTGMDRMVKRTAAGTHKQLSEIWKSHGNEQVKKKYGLNGVKSAFLIVPKLADDFPNCLLPGLHVSYRLYLLFHNFK